MDQYLTNLVRASLPPDARLIDPGHPTTQQSITPRSLSFIPVQIVSNVKSTSLLQLTFNTPPCYSDHFSSISQGSAMDELILLFVACVDLQVSRRASTLLLIFLFFVLLPIIYPIDPL